MVTVSKSGTSVFEPGRLAVEVIEVDDDAARVPALIVAPKDAGTYPGRHAPARLPPAQPLLPAPPLPRRVPRLHHGRAPVQRQQQPGAAVGRRRGHRGGGQGRGLAPRRPPLVLPDGVEPELSMLTLAGHSRGGHTAFALALGHAETRLVSFSALIGLDPVAGAGRNAQLRPDILTYEPPSFDTLAAGMPVLVVGTGLLPPCAPADVGHAEFYRECRPPCYHLVARDYGHLDLLDDDAPELVTGLVCESGDGPRDAMRRCVAGIVVAFLNAALGAEDGDLQAIVTDPAVAPAVLDPVEHRLP